MLCVSVWGVSEIVDLPTHMCAAAAARAQLHEFTICLDCILPSFVGAAGQKKISHFNNAMRVYRPQERENRQSIPGTARLNYENKMCVYVCI